MARRVLAVMGVACLLLTAPILSAQQVVFDPVGQTVTSLRFEIEGRPDLSPELAALSDSSGRLHPRDCLGKRRGRPAARGSGDRA